nr:MAG TPA: hypothetical protein [Caudoviricetes sp.]
MLLLLVLFFDTNVILYSYITRDFELRKVNIVGKMSVFMLIVCYLLYQSARNGSALSRECSTLWKEKQYYPTN